MAPARRSSPTQRAVLDLHCHLLPGVDDGPQTLDQALAIARAAVADGIRVAALTPHFHPQRYPISHRIRQWAFSEFVARLAAANIPLQLRLAGEVRIAAELPAQIAAGEVPFLGEVDGYRILLLEFPHALIPPGSEKLTAALLRQRIRPLIAHPERNGAVRARVDRLRPFVEQGCWLQITGDSLVGRFGADAEDAAWACFDAGWNCILASDAHNLDSRPPSLSAGREALRRRFGDPYATDHVITKPARILGITPSP